jgi:hypothetical protein
MTKAQMGIQNSATKTSRCHSMNVGRVSMVVPLLQIHITFIVGHWQLKSKFASSSNIPRTLEHKNSIQNASSHVFITMNHAITKQGRHIWSSTQFSKQNLLPHVSNPLHNIPLPTFHLYQNNAKDVRVIATLCNMFVHDYNAMASLSVVALTFIEHHHKGEVHWLEEF